MTRTRGICSTHREMTKPSEEQATMFQVQGSTELMSQPSRTWFSSFISFFTDIRAATACIVTTFRIKKLENHKKSRGSEKESKNKPKVHTTTFKINPLWRKKVKRRTTHCDQAEKEGQNQLQCSH